MKWAKKAKTTQLTTSLTKNLKHKTKERFFQCRLKDLLSRVDWFKSCF